jgi:large subunit ribosomal protein L9
MKVVLRQAVEHLGERGQVVSVKPGYARNYLLPKKLALPATPGNLKTLELHRKVWAVREARELDEARQYAGRLAAVSLTVAKKAGEHDTLYGSVTSSELAEMLLARGFDVDRRKILLEEPIKTLGAHTVRVKIHRQVTADLNVNVVPETE